MTTALQIDDPAYFDRLERVESCHWWSIGLWRLAASWLDAALSGRRHLKALDVGCGAGVTASRLRDRPEVASVHALDPSPDALALASRRGLDGVVLGSALALPIADESVDLVTCFDVLQHLPAGGDRIAASEIHRVLRPGGIALIRSNGRGGWKEDGEGSPYDLARLEAAVADPGLEIVRSTYVNCVPSLLQEFRGWMRTGARRGGHPSGGGLTIAVPPPWINRPMGWIAHSEAIAAGRWGLRLPFGHSTMALARRPGRPASPVRPEILGRRRIGP